MADVGLYVFGTSILWGQGHNKSTKLHTRFTAWLRNRRGRTVRVHYAPHSGAVLARRSNDKRLHGEVPTASPSVVKQISQAPGATENQVIVPIEGGINDVGVFKALFK